MLWSGSSPLTVVRDGMWGFLLFAGVAWLAVAWSVLRLEPADLVRVAGPVILFGAVTEAPQIDAVAFANYGDFSVFSALPFDFQNTRFFTNRGTITNTTISGNAANGALAADGGGGVRIQAGANTVSLSCWTTSLERSRASSDSSPPAATTSSRSPSHRRKTLRSRA